MTISSILQNNVQRFTDRQAPSLPAPSSPATLTPVAGPGLVHQALDKGMQTFQLRSLVVTVPAGSVLTSPANRAKSPYTPGVRPDLDQLARQSDADQLKQADVLAKDAIARVAGGHASLPDRLLAKFEMNQASQIRQNVASDLVSRYPDHGFDAGGSLLAAQIDDANAEEWQAFQKVQSTSDMKVSDGLTDLKAANEKFQLLEDNLVNPY